MGAIGSEEMRWRALGVVMERVKVKGKGRLGMMCRRIRMHPIAAE